MSNPNSFSYRPHLPLPRLCPSPSVPFASHRLSSYDAESGTPRQSPLHSTDDPCHLCLCLSAFPLSPLKSLLQSQPSRTQSLITDRVRESQTAAPSASPLSRVVPFKSLLQFSVLLVVDSLLWCLYLLAFLSLSPRHHQVDETSLVPSGLPFPASKPLHASLSPSRHHHTSMLPFLTSVSLTPHDQGTKP